jgi:predicted flap endonuclease-1-like 5' DNA nuclease
MAWLVTHMWMVLAGATVFALLLGWSVRGMLLTGKMRKAIVDKDIALTELDQARDEIERLFAAQRAQRGEGGNVADASARKISDLTSELQKAKTELAALKTETAKTSTAQPGPTGAKGEMPTIVLPPNRGGADDTPGQFAQAGAAPAKGEENEAEAPTLIWRNRHLEARVQHLEIQLAAVEAAPASAPATVETAEPVAVAEPTADEAGLDKLRWQADYLKQRVEALEAELAKAPAETPIVAEDDLNEEMARLRWRNRFLEGRLAYFEGGAEEAAAETPAEATGLASDDVSDSDVPAEEEAVPVYDEVEDTSVEEAAFDALPEPEAIVEEEMAVEEEVIIEDELEDVSEEEAVEPEAASFEDVSNDEEESLAEADHADEDMLSDEEYDEEDFVDADDSEDDADEDDESDDDEDDTDEQEDSYDEDSSEEDDESDDEESYEDDAEDELEDEAGEDNFEDDEDEAYDDDDAEEYDDSEDDDEADADDEDESDENDDEADEAWDDADDSEDDADEDDESDDDEDTDDGDVSYEAEETVLKERPMAMNGPVEGHPDDLTLIGGIGPKIQILLNELGVWHFDQIAEWTPENVAWMDEHLNFGGRIAREGWVEQAAVLVRDAESV